jgi:hypothetical protein
LNLEVIDLHAQFLADCLLRCQIVLSLLNLRLAIYLSLLLAVNLLSQLLNLDIRLLKVFLRLLVALRGHVELAVDLIDLLLMLSLGHVHLHLPSLAAFLLPAVASHHLLYLLAQLGYRPRQLLVLTVHQIHLLPQIVQLTNLGFQLGVLTFDFQG